MDQDLLIFIVLTVIGAAVVYFIVHLYFENRKQSEVRRILSTRFFLVTIPKVTTDEGEAKEPPKDFRQLIGVAEQMFASLRGISSHIHDKIMWEHERVSFEIVAYQGLISFYVAVPKMFEQMVEKQIHAYYPTAHIEPVKMPNIFDLPGGKGEMACAKLGLRKRFILPLKTYLKSESDTLSGVTNALSKLGEDSSAAIQIIVRPAGDNWRISSNMAAKKIQEGKYISLTDKWYMKVVNWLVDAFSDVAHGGAKAAAGQPVMENSKDKWIRLTPMQENTLKVLQEKSAKPAFNTMIRVVATGPDKMSANTNLEAIVSSFHQFGTPDLNELKVKHGSSDMVKEYILRRFSERGMLLNVEELASIFHFPNHNIDTPNIRWLLSKEMAPPANIPTEGVIMGKSVYRAQETLVRIKNDDRRRHLFMIGKTGTGKTTLFTNMIEQDMIEGRGCCFIDPNGDAIEDLLGKIPQHRLHDVILFDPSDTEFPAGLNMMEYHTPEQKDFIIQETIEIFYKLFDPNRTGMVGPQWEHWYRNAALTIMNQPGGGTLIDIPRIFTDDAFRNTLVSYVTDPIVKAFWQEQLAKTADFHKSEMYNYFISKFGRFMTNDLMRNIIGQKVSAFNFRQAMDEGKILLINLSKGKIGEINSNLLGMVIVSKIQMSAFSRADIPEENRRDFYLYVDEFQNFTTDSFAVILSEARKYRLNLNVANQYIAQLTEKIRDAVIGNAGTMVCYRIGAADAEFMVKEFPGVSIPDLTNLDKFNTYTKLLIDSSPSKPFSMKGIKSSLVSDPNIREYVKNYFRQNYTRPKQLVEQEISAGLQIGHMPAAGGNEPLRQL